MPYAIRPPDMSRNVALAGKTVSSRGMNVTYDEQGYVTKMVNYQDELFSGTAKSVRAPSMEAALADAGRSAYGGSAYDQQHFTDEELAHAADLRAQVANGQLEERLANYYINEIRRVYGYSGGSSGNEYASLFPGSEADESVASPWTVRKTYARADSAPTAQKVRESFQEQLERQREQERTLNELKDSVSLAPNVDALTGGLLDKALEENEDK